MRRKLILIFSLGLNMCLIVFLLAMFLRPRQSAFEPLVTNQMVLSNSASPKTRVVVRKQFFSWDEMISPDYRSYVSNLMAISCPPATIRDIIVADVNQGYSYRRLNEIPDPMEKWWQSIPDKDALAASTTQRRKLETERRDLLTSLLGTNWETASLPPQFNVCLTGRLLGDIGQDARKKVLEILQRAAQRKVSYELSISHDTSEKGRAGGYRILDDRTLSELQSIFTSPQMEEYLLRYSSVADDLRSNFQDFEKTPDEFLRVFRAVYPLQEKMALARADSSSYAEKLSELQNQVLQNVRLVIGAKRFQFYRARVDPIYRNALLEAGELVGSSRVVQSLYESLQSYSSNSQEILTSSNLTAKEKEARLAALQQEQQQEKEKILGGDTAAEPPAPPAAPEPQYQNHQFKPGETVDQIAAQYGVRPADILKANPDLDWNRLPRSVSIRVPVAQR